MGTTLQANIHVRENLKMSNQKKKRNLENLTQGWNNWTCLVYEEWGEMWLQFKYWKVAAKNSRIIIFFHVHWNRMRSRKAEREEGSFILRMFNSFRKTFLNIRIDIYWIYSNWKAVKYRSLLVSFLVILLRCRYELSKFVLHPSLLLRALSGTEQMTASIY